jgi:hypothetical protein
MNKTNFPSGGMFLVYILVCFIFVGVARIPCKGKDTLVFDKESLKGESSQKQIPASRNVFRCRVTDVMPAEETGTWQAVKTEIGRGGRDRIRTSFVDSRIVKLKPGDVVYVVVITMREPFRGDEFLIIPDEKAEEMIAKEKWELIDITKSLKEEIEAIKKRRKK